MESYLTTFNDVSLSAAEKTRRDDAHDIGLEQAGLSTGRRTRFSVGSERLNSGVSGKDKKKSALQTMLDIMLLDPDYAKAHFTAVNAVNDAMDFTQSAIERVLTALEAEHVILQDILDRAAQLPDGTRVFKDSNGNVRNENGEIVDATLAATILWNDTNPTYEEHQASNGRASELTKAANDLQGIQTELEDIDVELNNTDTPPPKERVDDLTGRIGELHGEAENKLNNLFEQSVQNPDDYSVTISTDKTIPTISGN